MLRSNYTAGIYMYMYNVHACISCIIGVHCQEDGENYFSRFCPTLMDSTMWQR